MSELNLDFDHMQNSEITVTSVHSYLFRSHWCSGQVLDNVSFELASFFVSQTFSQSDTLAITPAPHVRECKHF